MIRGGEPSLSDPSPVAMEAFLAQLQQVPQRGYAVNYGLTSTDEVGVASPVCDHRGEVVGAVLIAAPTYRVPQDSVGALGQQAAEAANEVSRRLGWTQLRRA